MSEHQQVTILEVSPVAVRARIEEIYPDSPMLASLLAEDAKLSTLEGLEFVVGCLVDEKVKAGAQFFSSPPAAEDFASAIVVHSVDTLPEPAETGQPLYGIDVSVTLADPSKATQFTAGETTYAYMFPGGFDQAASGW